MMDQRPPQWDGVSSPRSDWGVIGTGGRAGPTRLTASVPRTEDVLRRSSNALSFGSGHVAEPGALSGIGSPLASGLQSPLPAAMEPFDPIGMRGGSLQALSLPFGPSAPAVADDVFHSVTSLLSELEHMSLGSNAMFTSPPDAGPQGVAHLQPASPPQSMQSQPPLQQTQPQPHLLQSQMQPQPQPPQASLGTFRIESSDRRTSPAAAFRVESGERRPSPALLPAANMPTPPPMPATTSAYTNANTATADTSDKSNKAPQNFRNLFLAKLPEHLRFDDMAVILKAVLATLGPKGADAIPAPESTMVSLDPTTGVSKRFGFALFSSDSDGRRAQAVLNGASVAYDAHTKEVLDVTARGAQPPPAQRHGATVIRLVATGSKFDGATAAAESPCLYVRNIPNTCTTEEITTLLSRYGPLAFCAVRGDHLQRPVWVVFAEYKDTDSARRALNALHGNRELFPSSGTAVMAKYADTQEQREQRRNVRGRVIDLNAVSTPETHPQPSSQRSDLSTGPDHAWNIQGFPSTPPTQQADGRGLSPQMHAHAAPFVPGIGQGGVQPGHHGGRYGSGAAHTNRSVDVQRLFSPAAQPFVPQSPDHVPYTSHTNIAHPALAPSMAGLNQAFGPTRQGHFGGGGPVAVGGRCPLPSPLLHPPFPQAFQPQQQQQQQQQNPLQGQQCQQPLQGAPEQLAMLGRGRGWRSAPTANDSFSSGASSQLGAAHVRRHGHHDDQ